MPQEVYAFRSNDLHLMQATSGGAFMAIAESFFQMYIPKAHVYGVTFDKDLHVTYDMADNLCDCRKFSGSKYVRSRMNGVFHRVLRDLDGGIAVLFTGTPCCVAALQQFLVLHGADTETLFCVDLICHGTPRPEFWETYKNWLQKKYKSSLVGFEFRTHGIGKTGYSCSATFANGKTYSNILAIQVYNRLFLRRYLFFEGCFRCRHACLARRGDLTIGDFWGIAQTMPQFPFRQDVSEILVNSAKGKTLLQSILDVAMQRGHCISPCTSNEYIKYQNNLQRPADKPPDFDQFQKDFKTKDFSFVAAKYAGYDLPHRARYFLFGK